MPRFLKVIGIQWHNNVAIIFIALTVVVTAGSDCRSNPCYYGICVDDPNSTYRCYCIDGYTGINCEINWDDCWSSPCLNGGTCNDAIASYNCTCSEGYVGMNCEQKYSECMNHPCLNNGTCLDYNGFTCQCLEGFSGEFCEIDASVCNNTVCKNAGECVEGPGYSFTCRCPDGWTGKYCEDDVNECIVSPCQNGGLCINTPGTYTCACLFGFTGKDCDKKVIPCDENPCENNAVCLFEDDQPVCYCVPDYHGAFCELRYDDCESKNAHCENGGTCIDGINNFTCSCPAQYTGTMCTEFIDIPETTTTTTMETTTISDIPTYLPTDSYTTETMGLPETTLFDITTIFNDVSTTEKLNLTTTPSITTTTFETPVVTGEIEYTTMQESTTEKSSDITQFTKVIETSTMPIESRTESETDGFTTSKLEYTTMPEEKTSTTFVTDVKGFTSPTIEETTFAVYTTESMSQVYPIQTPDSHVLTTAPSTTTTMETVVNQSTTQAFTLPDMMTTMESITSTQIPVTIGTTSESTPTVTSQISDYTSSFEGTSIASSTESPVTVKPTVTTTTSSPERPVDTDYDETISSNSTVVSYTEKISPSVTASSIVTMVSSTIRPTEILTTTESTDKLTSSSMMTTTTTTGTQTMGPTTAEVDFYTVTEFHKTTFGMDIDSSQATIITPTTTEYQMFYSCTKDQCANTSLCIFNGTQCDCSYQNNCKKFSSIKNAAFSGKSYIRQKFEIHNGTLSIFARLKTKAKNGILIHALFDNERYVLLYMETGQLKFQFSCGLQTMLFGELDSPINNGFDVDVEMRFQYIVEEISDKCSARLYVNGSAAMSGEQTLQTHDSVPQVARLHLGGIPVAFSHQFPHIVLGFVGCMSLMKVNGVRRDFIHDSVEAVQIEECNSFLCLSNPCKNYGACEESNGKISCKCVAGYSGETCERSICDNNPCYLGATCLTSPGVSFICICPLGSHGLLCEKDTAIVQPSFTVFAPGYSSYLAYGISSSLKDNMQLKLRIIPQTLEQISLIAYMGQSGSKRDSSDHFSITYVRGYVMLTWDLGSGVRRIFTSTPLNVRSHKAHIIQIGRKGRDSWLHVEGVGNVTGRAAGSNTRLDVSPILYIGGHKLKYFQSLPHDLPLHSGFLGCIYDIELRTDDNVFPLTMSSPATGRGVGECYRNECSHHSCKNGAVCLNYGPTYSCICMKDWEGPDCSSPVNCTSSSSLCHKNSK